MHKVYLPVAIDIYFRAVALLPCPQLWAILFFFMILLLGLDSQFVGLEAIITAVTDMYPQYRKGMKRQYLLFTIVGVSFAVGLTMCLDVSGTYLYYIINYNIRVEFIFLHCSITMERLVFVCYGFVYASAWLLVGYTVSKKHCLISLNWKWTKVTIDYSLYKV